jgi:hypothetical protein
MVLAQGLQGDVELMEKEETLLVSMLKIRVLSQRSSGD